MKLDPISLILEFKYKKKYGAGTVLYLVGNHTPREEITKQIREDDIGLDARTLVHMATLSGVTTESPVRLSGINFENRSK